MPFFKKEEISQRIERLREKLKEKGLNLGLIVSPLNIYYFTNTFVRGTLLIGASQTKLLVNRPFERAKEESFVECEPLKSLKDLPSYIKSFTKEKKIGLEINTLNPETFSYYKELLSDWEIEKIDEIIMEIRMIKTPYEIDCIKKAGKMLNNALKRAFLYFKPGMKEIEASAILEKELRLLGHPGITRSLHGFELTYGHLISGKEATIPSHTLTAQGGLGIAGFPGGASSKKLRKNDPILIDFSGYYEGYYIDQTRMASFKPLKKASLFFETALEILSILEKEVKPGIKSEEVYDIAFSLAEKKGLKNYFMCHGGNIKFVGHGVGIQIDEPPALAYKQKIPLKENMVIAIEPKFHVPEIGVIGIEETYVVTKSGLQKLTITPKDWIFLDK